MSEERYVQSIMNELDEALSAYRNMLYNQAEYEMKNNRPSPYQRELFENILKFLIQQVMILIVLCQIHIILRKVMI